jgi:hypothetical protein
MKFGRPDNLCIAANARPTPCQSGDDSLEISEHPGRVTESVIRLGGNFTTPYDVQ